MAFHILLTLKNETMRQDLPVYFGAVPVPGEVMTLEIEGRVMQVRVTEISVDQAKRTSAGPICTVRAMEM
jgi:hypothetical protein